MTRILASILAAAWVLGSAPAAHAADPSVTDLSISQLASVRHAKVGATVTFTSVGADLGPDPVVDDSFDVFISSSQGVDVTEMVCDHGVSPDTPFCQYGPVDVNEQLTTQVVTQILATGGKTASLTVCVTRETSDWVDPIPGNSCATTTVKVIGKRKP